MPTRFPSTSTIFSRGTGVTIRNLRILRDRYDSILNKTPISYKANRTIGGEAPSCYLPKLQRMVDLDKREMDDLLASHALAPDLLRRDAFDEFFEDRRRRLSRLVEAAMGKPVIQISRDGGL